MFTHFYFLQIKFSSLVLMGWRNKLIPFAFLNSSSAIVIPPFFTAVGTNVCCWSEDNGLSWTSGVMPAGAWRGVAKGNGIWVAVGHAGRTAISTDGKNFTSSTTIGTLEFNDITFAEYLGLFVTVARLGTTNQIRTSPDGVTWETRNIGTTQGWNAIASNSNIIIVQNSTSGSSTLRYARSNDSISWTRYGPGEATAGWGLKWVKDRFLGGRQGIIDISIDGINWTQFNTLSSSNKCPVYLESRDMWCLLTTTGPGYFWSTDGSTFTRIIQSGLTAFEKAASSSDAAIAVRSSGNTFYRALNFNVANAWDSISVPTGAYFGICYG